MSFVLRLLVIASIIIIGSVLIWHILRPLPKPTEEVQYWSLLNNLYNYIAIGLTLAAAFCAFMVFFTGSKAQNAKDIQSNKVQREADERISQSNASAAIAQADAAFANASAGSATADAAKAKEATQLIEKQNLQLQRDLSNTNTQADIEKQKLAKTQIEVSNALTRQYEAERRQAEAERKLLLLSEKVKQRVISPQQRNQILDALKHQPRATNTVHITSNASDSESAIYAEQIAHLLIDAGWKVDNGQGFFGGTPLGLFIQVKDKTSPTAEFAGIIQHAFKTAGIELTGEVQPEREPEEIHLIVGSKNP